MKRMTRVMVALGVTTLIFVPGYFFVTSVSLPLAEVTGMSEVENIRHFTTLRVVPPEWVTPGPDGLRWSWMKAECVSRLVLVLAIWLATLICVNPDKWKTRKSNNGIHDIVAKRAKS